MKGDLHVFFDFYPKYPSKSSMEVIGMRENGRLSYCSTPIMQEEYRIKIYLKDKSKKDDIVEYMTKDCESIFGYPVKSKANDLARQNDMGY